ncbi:MAG: hypothetical protein M1402_01080 [Candidatus Thermoplasmatota archaeon]|jgi:hypothetical protein|nr:hypothetical protein [Candidatus Thermoplasmatota archaeon]
MNLTDLIGSEITALILGQYQESLTPELYIHGVLRGIDQSAYIIESMDARSPNKITVIPIGQCVLSVKRNGNNVEKPHEEK